MPDKSQSSVAGPRYLFEVHILTHFDCEHTFLAIFLREKALEEGRQDLSRTYVLLDTDEPAEESVVGYFTLRAEWRRLVAVVDSRCARSTGRRGRVLIALMRARLR